MTWPREREWVGGREIESGCVGEREQERVRDREWVCGRERARESER